MFARLLVEAVPRTEDASGAAGGGFHAPGAPENASRTTGGCFALLKLRPVHQEALSGTEYHLRTPEAFF